jgi:hypothetical protein
LLLCVAIAAQIRAILTTMDKGRLIAALCRCHLIGMVYGQQPGGGDTPGVAAAPVALAGAIVPGAARFIVMLSAHPDVFGVGITPVAGSMLVPPSCATSC